MTVFGPEAALTAYRGSGREGETKSPSGPNRPSGWEDRSGRRKPTTAVKKQ